jgi:hypothetical protein
MVSDTKNSTQKKSIKNVVESAVSDVVENEK